MRNTLIGLTVAGLGFAALTLPSQAHACGGCFGPVDTPQVVTDHRMAMAIHSNQAILWDQIRYSGRPEDFSWVLPVWGDVQIELASGEFFDRLDSQTRVSVRAPFVNLFCNSRGTFAPSAGTQFNDSASADAGTVTVIREEVVGPYQTVTLRSTDSNALAVWLRSNNYAIPASIEPIIDYYVTRHMDFLALRLRPGQGIQSMQPVRIRYSTANMVLPLRMVAAGIADKVGITLWVFGSGRYESANFANGVVNPRSVFWNWTTSTSNYLDVFRETQNALSNGRSWITEYAQPSNNIQWFFTSGSGPFPRDGGLPEDPSADWNLATRNNSSDVWVTRMRSDLAARFLDADLQLQASTNLQPVSNSIQVIDGNEIGRRPTPNCPDNPIQPSQNVSPDFVVVRADAGTITATPVTSPTTRGVGGGAACSISGQQTGLQTSWSSALFGVVAFSMLGFVGRRTARRFRKHSQQN